MLKNISKLEVVIEGKVHSFLTDSDAQLSHCKEALFQFLKFIGQIEDQAKAQQEQQKALESVVKVEDAPESKVESLPVMDEVKQA